MVDTGADQVKHLVVGLQSQVLCDVRNVSYLDQTALLRIEY